MRIGTKSVLFGAHCFFLHPLFVALGWHKLHGFRKVQDRYVTTSLLDPRLWVAFFVHDIGYLGKPNMDGAEGEEHPQLGARIMHVLFDPRPLEGDTGNPIWPWGDFVLFHSRYLAKKWGARPSALCIADKYAPVLEPSWLYLPRVIASGEVVEYVNNWKRRNGLEHSSPPTALEIRAWYSHFRQYMVDWIAEHRDGREDTWTDRSWRDERKEAS